MPWKTFLKAHFGVVAATDFFTVEVLTLVGLVRYYVLFVIDIETRRVHIAGVVHQPHGARSRSSPAARASGQRQKPFEQSCVVLSGHCAPTQHGWPLPPQSAHSPVLRLHAN